MSELPEEMAFVELDWTPQRVYVVGDIHGSAIALEALLNFLESKVLSPSEDLLVFLGDYVDRGPDSYNVLELLLQFREVMPRTIFLKGNHEVMLLETLREPLIERIDGYFKAGGKSTLTSYGVDADFDPLSLSVLPRHHLEFLTNLERYCIGDDFVCVHAGLHPLRELFDQLDEHIYWIRDEFIKNIHHFERLIVFGHTPFQELFVDAPYKLGIDTGLVFGGKLSCIELRERRVFEVRAGSDRIKSRKKVWK